VRTSTLSVVLLSLRGVGVDCLLALLCCCADRNYALAFVFWFFLFLHVLTIPIRAQGKGRQGSCLFPLERSQRPLPSPCPLLVESVTANQITAERLLPVRSSPGEQHQRPYVGARENQIGNSPRTIPSTPRSPTMSGYRYTVDRTIR